MGRQAVCAKLSARAASLFRSRPRPGLAAGRVLLLWWRSSAAGARAADSAELFDHSAARQLIRRQGIGAARFAYDN